MRKQIVSVLSLSLLTSATMVYGQKKGSDTALQEQKIEEVVLINVGYGRQKKSVVTGAISKVNAQELEKVPNGRVEQALQGRTAGVNIAANSGSPGSASTVRVRGITTFGSANDPLYVVDGIPMSASSIGAINQSDIESIEVLKDAASAAIYGTRAATGVVLITTKKGRKGKLNINYNGFYGVSAPERVVNVLNAREYAALINEKYANAGQSIPFPDISVYGKGTDWQKEIFSNNAMRENHEASVSGGNENSNFFMSFGYQDIQGIVATETSRYAKKNFRINSQHKLFGKVNVGQNFMYTHQKQLGIGSQNTEYGGVLGSAIMMDPLTPVVVTDPVVANSTPYTENYVIRDSNGNPYGISNMVGQEIVNPLAFIQTQLGNFGWSDDFVGNIFADAEILKGLTVRSSLGGKLSYWGNEYFSPLFYLNATNANQSKNSITRNTNKALDWIWTNTINYARKIDKHDFSVLLGQEVNVLGIGYNSGVTHYNLPTNNWYEANFNYEIAEENKRGWSYDNIEHRLTSLFARLNYNYAEKYIFTGIIRRDGSSKFGPNKKFGYFPSFSLGWVVSNEDFWADNDYFNMLKIRGGYGKTGTTGSLGDFYYMSLVKGGYNYTFNNTIYVGNAPSTVENPDLHWEETAQTNIGFDARLFKNFNVSFDVYKKKTSGILGQLKLPGYVGVGEQPWANIADMENQGIEVELSYNKKWEDFSFSVNGSFSTLKNKVTNIGDQEYLLQDAPGYQSMEGGNVTRTVVGQPYNSFYGYQTLGVFQNTAQIHSYVGTNGQMIQPDAQPGDFIWQDTNGDGVITEDDRVFLGSPLPKYTFGLTLNFGYKNFDFMAFAQGAAGNKIFQGLRRLDIADANYLTTALGRWHGEGTSNDYPRLTNTDTNSNFSRMSNFYLEKGDYLRLKIVQLGYSLPQNVAESISANKVRLYISAENLYTLTKYTGYDPEIGGTVYGIDKGYYPQARTFMFGVNVQF